jgi:Major Facilitator Superfamily.
MNLTTGVIPALRRGETCLLSSRDVRVWLIYGSLIYYVSYSLVSLVENIYEALLDIALVTVGEIIVSPIVQALAMSMAEEDKRGQYMGIFGLATSIGRTMGSVLSSETMQFMSNDPLALWQVLSLPAAASAIIYTLLFKLNRRLINLVKVT